MALPAVRTVSIVGTTSIPAATTAADRNRDYRCISYRAWGEKSPAERTEKRAIAR